MINLRGVTTCRAGLWMIKSRSIGVLFGLEILALATYMWHQTVSVFIGWERGWLYLQIVLLIVFLALLSIGLYTLLHSIGQGLSKRTGQESSEIQKAFILALSPLLILFLIFLQYAAFLKDIRPYLLPVSLTGCAYLLMVTVSRLKEGYPQAFTAPEILRRLTPGQLSAKRLAWIVFLLSLGVYVIYASGLIVPAQPLTGDDPHYLLTTQSIVKDGDINVYNNYKDKDYAEFYPGELALHAFPGKKGPEFLYSKHFIAQSALMIPTYALAKKMIQWNSNWSDNPETQRRIIVFFARLPFCLISALLGLVFFHLVLDMTRRKDVSVLAWAVFNFTSPILFFSHLLYPAVSVALLAIFVFKYLILNNKTSFLNLFLSGAAIGLLPWFGVKFIVLAALLFGISAFVLLSVRETRNFWKGAILFLTPIVVSAAFYLLYFWSIYGNFSPILAYTGISHGSSPPIYPHKFIAFPLVKVLIRSLGYFIDQKYGIFIYAPIYVLGGAGLFFFFRKKRREAILLLVAMTGFWVFSSIYYWGGYCPPGRPIIPVFWIWGLFLAVAFTQNLSRFRKTTLCAGTALSAGMVWASLRDPWILYHGPYGSELGGEFLYSKLTRALSNSFVQFHNLLPSLREIEVLNWLTLIIWIMGLVVIVILFIKKNEAVTKSSPFLKIAGHLCFVFLVSLLLLTYVFFDIHLENKEIYANQNYELYFQDDNHFGKEIDGFWTKGKRPTSVILKSLQPLSAMEVTVTSSVGGTTSVQAGPIKKKVKRTKSTGFAGKAVFSSIKGFPMREGYLYRITIADSSGFVPYQLDKNVGDNRYLGVFVQIKARESSD